MHRAAGQPTQLEVPQAVHPCHPAGWDHGWTCWAQHVNKSAVLISWTNLRDGATTLFVNGRAPATLELGDDWPFLHTSRSLRASVQFLTIRRFWLDGVLEVRPQRRLGSWAKNQLPRH